MFSENCEMAYGDQAALIGLLTQLEPSLAIEVGTYVGGSLDIIAGYCEEVHTFDLVSHVTHRLPNVKYHLGDSKETLAPVLAEFAAAGRNVDFVLVDGDHARQGVRADVTDLLESPAIARTVILLHDAANEDVRAGIRDARLDRTKIVFADLSFTVPAEDTHPLAEKWGGFAIIVVDERGDLWPHQPGLSPNAAWATSAPQPLAWRAARPLRLAKRRVGYRVRPIVRHLRGTRGKALGG